MSDFFLKTWSDTLPQNTQCEVSLRLLTHVGFFSKKWSDTFRNVLICGKEQESDEKVS